MARPDNGLVNPCWHVTLGTRKNFFRVQNSDPLSYIAAEYKINIWDGPKSLREFHEKVGCLYKIVSTF